MLEWILPILGALLLIAVGILAVRAVKFQRRTNAGCDFHSNESRWMEGRGRVLSGDYVGGDGNKPGDYYSGGSAHF